ncbi:flagellar basal-body MS-ring/collar protein FliF [Massilia aurea]|uniref:flagellar basal-body MS-ring/collar protein FliF n=1 Tax=Massilia aurea TaxID=373040 RepID=UPI0021631D38|nr:flagellar basal-body MS-ring/collar protein FliF [Massilia aurea]
MLSSLKSPFSGKFALPALPPLLRNNLPLMLGLAVAVTAAVMMFMWQDQSSYKPVFGAREKVVAADMMTVLEAEQIPYRVHPDSGQVLVPSSQLGKVRMLLAAKGVTAQLPAGLELMDRNDPLGVSQFVQDVRFRRGLEGELAQSILTMDSIASARVHLAIAKTSSFVTGNADGNSASVVVAVKPGRSLGNEQIAAIVNMVSGSVAGLSPQRVSLVDQAGNYLSARIDLADGFDGATQGDTAAKRHADEVRSNVNDLLAPILGMANYKVSVTAAVDNDRVEETQEKYGEAPKVTSEAMREEMEKSRMAMGVPGTLSNRPPAPATADAAGAPPAEKTDDGNARKNATTRQYAYDRAITQIKRERGRLKKLSVAVVLNASSAADGKAWTPAELTNIEKILAGGLGIDAARGDVLAVSAMKFPAAPVEQAWWQERDNIVDMASWLLWAVGALLAYFLLARPLLRAVTTRLAPSSPSTATPALAGAAAAPLTALPAGVTALEAPAQGSPGAVIPLLENYDLPPSGSPVDVMVDHLRVLAAKEPERVAEVVKQWVQKKHGRTE